MKSDVVLAGVGGQGVLSAAAVIAGAALRQGWNVKQSEVHGMAQRGGAVVAHLRMASGPVHSDLIPRGAADLILALEPMEGLRHLEYLRRGGAFVTDVEPVLNIDDYPDVAGLLDSIRALPMSLLIEATALARQAGNVKAANLVIVGAGARLLPVSETDLIDEINVWLGSRSEEVLRAGLAAFRLGVDAAGTPFSGTAGGTRG